MRKTAQTLWAVFLLIFPFSLRFIVYDADAYRFGHFNPWVTGFLYGPELILWSAFLLWVGCSWKTFRVALEKISPLVLFFLTAFFLNAGAVTFLRGDMALFGFFALRFFEAMMVYFLTTSNLLSLKTMVRFLLIGAMAQLGLGIGQYLLNHSVGFSLIGEPFISAVTDNVAKTDLSDGAKQIRPYGTFLHPNILAAYLLMVLFMLLPLLKKSSLLFWLALLVGGIYFTGSLAAMIAVGVVLLLMLMGKHVRPVFSTITVLFLILQMVFFFRAQTLQFEEFSWQARAEQAAISKGMILKNPLGVGVGNFTLEMENFSPKKLEPWEFQPVHNLMFLVLNETGIQGLLLLLLGFFLVLTHRGLAYTTHIFPFAALFVIAAFDHFLWDSFTGLMMVALAAGYCYKESVTKEAQ